MFQKSLKCRILGSHLSELSARSEVVRRVRIWFSLAELGVLGLVFFFICILFYKPVKLRQRETSLKEFEVYFLKAWKLFNQWLRAKKYLIKIQIPYSCL